MQTLADFQHALVQELALQQPPQTIARNQYLLQAGQVERHFYFIESGAVQLFYVSEHEEHIIRLGYQGSIINVLPSFLQGTPSRFYLQAIRKTVLRAVPKNEWQQWLEATPERLHWYNKMLELLLADQVNREIDLLSSSPIERLRRVEARSPQVFQEVPSRYIASYLRMTPETLSRIRKG